MNRSELITVISDNTNLTRNQVENVLDNFAEVVGKCLAKGEKVVLTGFGTFEVRNRVSRVGRNPRSGAAIDIPALRTPAFKSGKALKEVIRGE